MGKPVDVKSVKEFETFFQGYDIIFIDFWATWCGPCKEFSPIVDAFAEKNDDIKVLKVNVDEVPKLAELFQIRSIPTSLFIKKRRPIIGGAGVRKLEELNEIADKIRKDENLL